MKRALLMLAAAALASAASAGELELSYGREALSGGRAPWSALALEASWVRADRAALGLTLRELERFGLRDLEVAVAAAAPLAARLAIEAEASASPAHHVVPAWGGALRLDAVLGKGFVAATGGRWTRYEVAAQATTVQAGTLGLERYFGPWRLAWTAELAGVEGAWGGSQRVAWDLYYGERDRVGMTLAIGREVEVESAGGAQLVASRVLAAGLTGRHGIGEGWALTYGAGVVRQGDLYTRTGARLGLRRAF